MLNCKQAHGYRMHNQAEMSGFDRQQSVSSLPSFLLNYMILSDKLSGDLNKGEGKSASTNANNRCWLDIEGSCDVNH